MGTGLRVITRACVQRASICIMCEHEHLRGRESLEIPVAMVVSSWCVFAICAFVSGPVGQVFVIVFDGVFFSCIQLRRCICFML